MIFRLLTVLCITFFASAASYASTTGGVGSGTVNKDALSFEVRAAYTIDNDSKPQDDRITSRIHYDYGFTDMYALRLVLGQNKQKNDSIAHSDFAIENRIQFFEKNRDGFTGAIRLIYFNNDSRADSIQSRFLAGIDIDKNWKYLHNVTVGHEVGERSISGLLLDNRLQFIRDTDFGNAGIEMFNNFGNLSDDLDFDEQNHVIGPFVRVNLPYSSFLEVGTRHGISKNAGDHTLRTFIAKNF